MKFSEQIAEVARCIRSTAYFCNNHCKVLDPQNDGWIPFELWPAQVSVAAEFDARDKIIALKARQLGWTWLAVAKVLKRSMFWPHSVSLMYSLRDNEAIELLTRLRGMYDNLTTEMRFQKKLTGNAHVLQFPNGSKVHALPTTAGDSYTANIVVLDEADIMPNLNELLRRVKPTIDNGGQLIAISRSNKDKPDSTFKRIYRAAKCGANDWHAIFAPWSAHPKRDQAWYDKTAKDIEERTGALDDMYEQYPATDNEALSARELSKRIAPKWLEECFENLNQLIDDVPTSIPGLRVWEKPRPGERYTLGVDVAEGKEKSDDSAVVVFDSSGAQVAELHGRIEITVFSGYVHEIAKFYNDADILVERNNHGHAVITRLSDLRANLLRGRDRSYGHLSDARGKAEMYAAVAERAREKTTKIRSERALYQLSSIERGTLRAPEGMLDDIADAFAIGIVGLNTAPVYSDQGFELV